MEFPIGDNEAIAESFNLPDDVPRIHSTSGALARFHAKKSARHQEILDDLNAQISAISDQTEIEVGGLLIKYSELVKNFQKDLMKRRTKVASVDFLRSIELEKLESEWQDVTEVQKLTHEKLQAIDDDFAQIEISRSKKMTELYNRSGKLLKQNAFVPADVCQTVIDREILEMNNSVLKNHRQILNVKQICTDKITFDSLDAEKEFASHKATWKTLQIEQFIKVFRDYIDSTAAKNPPQIVKIQENLTDVQKNILKTRKTVFEELKDFVPPIVTKNTVYDWFGRIRQSQDDLEQVYKDALIEMHAAFADGEMLMKRKHSILFDQLMEIKAGEELMQKYDEKFSAMVEERVDAYHQQLKFMEQNVKDFFDKCQKQLFKFKNFLIGVTTIWDHHLDSIQLRDEQFENEFSTMASEQEQREKSTEFLLEKMTQRIRDEICETKIEEHLKEARQVLYTRNESMKSYSRQKVTVAKMRPSVFAYELEIYILFLKRFLINPSREWKIMELWEYDVDSNYECEDMSEELRKNLSSWLKLLDNRRRRRGGPPVPRRTTIVQAQKFLTPRERQRLIVKNYFHKRSPQNMINWWLQETRAPKANQNRQRKYSKARFKSIIRRNSHQLNRGKIDSLVNHLGDKIRVSEAVPQYMRTAAILDKDLDELIKNIKNSFLKHFESYSKEQSEKEQTNADKLVKSCESELRAKLRKTEPRIQFLELNVGAVRCEELQLQKDQMVERQRTIANCLNEVKARKEQVLEKQAELIESLENIAQEMEPKMQQATKAAQLIDMLDQANARFDEIRDEVSSIVTEYASWSAQKLDDVKAENKKVISEMQNKTSKCANEPLRKMEALMNKAFFLYNKEIEFTLPDKLKEIAEAKRVFHKTKYIPHQADLEYLEQMERSLTSSQIQLSSEMSETSRRLNALEKYVADYVAAVSKYESIEEAERSKFVEYIIKYKNETNQKISEVVDFFNCRIGMLKMPRREFYSNWLSGKCHQSQLNSTESNASLMTDDGRMQKRKSTMRLRSTVNALGSALLIRPRPSNALALGGHLDRKQSKMGGGLGGSMGMTRRIIRDPKTETKIAIFGEAKAPPGEDFQCRMTKLLLEATDKVLSLAENYHKHRGVRPITRPNLIRENFERTCDFTMFKMIDFERKSKDFCAKCFIEILKIVRMFTASSKSIMGMIFFERQKIHTEDVACQIFSVQKRYQRLFDALNEAGDEHLSKIRTSLGHPENKEELAMLEKKERDRQFKAVKGITERHRDLRKSLDEITLKQIDNVCSVVEETLFMEDDCIAEKDLVEIDYSGDEPIIRTTFTGLNRLTNWQDVAIGRLPKYEAKKLKTKKATDSQKEVIMIRDNVISQIEERYVAYLNKFEGQKSEALNEADRWKKCWDTSIREVKMLYNICGQN